MKKILFALAILPLLAFVGCSSDDDDNTPKVDFKHNIEMLYGEWRATEVEVLEGLVIDLTAPEVEENVPATYVTFEKDGSFSSKGILGEGKGEYSTKGEKISATIGEDKLSFDMTLLEATTAKIKLNPHDVDFGTIEIPSEIKVATIILTKQQNK